MRFAAVKVPKHQQPARKPVAEILRRIVAGEVLGHVLPTTAPPGELPVELDQRVRLVGEW